jgi:predicted dehydrogenase
MAARMKVRLGIVGCGNIAGRYAETLAAYPETELVGVTDIDLGKAEALAAEHGCRVYPSLEALLADERIDLVVNLTIHYAHKAVTAQCLEAGKHVYSEKPLAITPKDAQELVSLAHEKGLRLGCSPFTFMGEAQQTAWKHIREGRLGTVRLAYAEVNWGRIESWHPAPAPFYEVGPLFDVGVYPLALLTAIFGPARKVLAYGKVLYPERITKEGIPFSVSTPDFMTAAIELENGSVIRLTTNFYVGHSGKQVGIEFHGDLGSLHLASWQNPDAGVEFAEFAKPYAPVPLIKEAHKIAWGRGVQEMAEAMLAGRPHRASGEQAAHVVEILDAVAASAKEGKVKEISSSFTPPPPMEWAT